MTLWSLLYVLVTLGVIAMVLAKSLPVYFNAHDIQESLNWAAQQPDLQSASAADIQAAIQRRFDAGYVDNITARDIAVEAVTNGRMLEVKYDVRRSLFFNISLVYSFDETAHLNGNGSGGGG